MYMNMLRGLILMHPWSGMGVHLPCSTLEQVDLSKKSIIAWSGGLGRVGGGKGGEERGGEGGRRLTW